MNDLERQLIEDIKFCYKVALEGLERAEYGSDQEMSLRRIKNRTEAILALLESIDAKEEDV